MKERAFGDLLREFRIAAALSQEALAERARLSPGAISALERSVRRGPQHRTLSLLAEALALDPERRSKLEEAADSGRRRAARSAILRALPAVSKPNNLPSSMTSFHGRTGELADLARLVIARRLVTLLGPGGVGKTRLALESARGLTEAKKFSDGIWFVDLAPLGSAQLVTTAIARAARVREEAGAPLLETLRKALAKKRVLLLLDNCEHVLDTCASVAETLLRDAPGLTILATTREALRIDGECVFRVPPLPFETAERSGPALDLLVERLSDADFGAYSHLSSEQLRFAGAICRRLDGIPLALELAAGRARDLSLSQIAAGLDARFDLLSAGLRTASPRQSTLRGMIDWSYELLEPDERALFARLGLFAGAFTPEAAVHVCASEALDVRSGLGALIAKSLVGLVHDRDGHLRYRLLETMRAFALERLHERGEYEAFARRFATAFCRAAQAADATYGRISKSAFLASVEPDLENFRSALAWTLEAGNDPRLGADLAGAMGWIYRQTALFAEGVQWAESALTHAANLEPLALA